MAAYQTDRHRGLAVLVRSYKRRCSRYDSMRLLVARGATNRYRMLNTAHKKGLPKEASFVRRNY